MAIIVVIFVSVLWSHCRNSTARTPTHHINPLTLLRIWHFTPLDGEGIVSSSCIIVPGENRPLASKFGCLQQSLQFSHCFLIFWCANGIIEDIRLWGQLTFHRVKKPDMFWFNLYFTSTKSGGLCEPICAIFYLICANSWRFAWIFGILC